MMENIQNMFIVWGTKLAGALVVLLVGLKLIGYLENLILATMQKRQVDPTLHSFITSLVGITLKILLFISVASILGVAMTSFVALLGAMGLAVGMSLQGSLSNFAGGILILVLKPFKVGDFITGAGHAGTVKQITIFYTYLTTVDNVTIIIPNAALSNSSVINYSVNDLRRVDLAFRVNYGSDIKHVKAVIRSVVDGHSLIIQDPEPFVRLGAQSDNSLEFAVRVWVKNGDYWTVYHDISEQIKEKFDEEGIDIPYPHLINIAKKQTPADE